MRKAKKGSAKADLGTASVGFGSKGRSMSQSEFSMIDQSSIGLLACLMEFHEKLTAHEICSLWQVQRCSEAGLLRLAYRYDKSDVRGMKEEKESV